MEKRIQFSINNITPIIPLFLTTTLYTLLIMAFKSSILVLPCVILLYIAHLNPIMKYLTGIMIPISLVLNIVCHYEIYGISLWGFIFVTLILYINKLYLDCNDIATLVPVSMCALCYLYNKIDKVYKDYSIYANVLKGTIMFTITLLFSIAIRYVIPKNMLLGVLLIILLILICVVVTCYIINTITYDLNYTSSSLNIDNINTLYNKLIGFVNTKLCYFINIILIFTILYGNYKFNIKYTCFTNNFIQTIVCSILLIILFTALQLKSTNAKSVDCITNEINYNKFHLSISNLAMLSEIRLMIASKFCTNPVDNAELETIRVKLNESINLTRKILALPVIDPCVINELLKSLKVLLTNYFEIVLCIERNSVESDKDDKNLDNDNDKILNINKYLDLFIANTSKYIQSNNQL